MLKIALSALYLDASIKGQPVLPFAPQHTVLTKIAETELLLKVILLGRGGPSVQPSGAMHMWKESLASPYTGVHPHTKPKEA